MFFPSSQTFNLELEVGVFTFQFCSFLSLFLTFSAYVLLFKDLLNAIAGL